MPSDPPSTPGELVASFIAHLESRDLERALDLLAPDCTYDNVPFGPVMGVDAVRSTLAPFMAAFSTVEWRILHQLESGSLAAGTVLNERLDRFGTTATDTEWLELAVAGVFEIHDHRIRLWRDYFDRAPLLDWMARRG